jgi:hypothetical protein
MLTPKTTNSLNFGTASLPRRGLSRSFDAVGCLLWSAKTGRPVARADGHLALLESLAKPSSLSWPRLRGDSTLASGEGLGTRGLLVWKICLSPMRCHTLAHRIHDKSQKHRVSWTAPQARANAASVKDPTSASKIYALCMLHARPWKRSRGTEGTSHRSARGRTTARRSPGPQVVVHCQ